MENKEKQDYGIKSFQLKYYIGQLKGTNVNIILYNNNVNWQLIICKKAIKCMLKPIFIQKY